MYTYVCIFIYLHIHILCPILSNNLWCPSFMAVVAGRCRHQEASSCSGGQKCQCQVQGDGTLPGLGEVPWNGQLVLEDLLLRRLRHASRRKRTLMITHESLWMSHRWVGHGWLRLYLRIMVFEHLPRGMHIQEMQSILYRVVQTAEVLSLCVLSADDSWGTIFVCVCVGCWATVEWRASVDCWRTDG